MPVKFIEPEGLPEFLGATGPLQRGTTGNYSDPEREAIAAALAEAAKKELPEELLGTAVNKIDELAGTYLHAKGVLKQPPAAPELRTLLRRIRQAAKALSKDLKDRIIAPSIIVRAKTAEPDKFLRECEALAVAADAFLAQSAKPGPKENVAVRWFALVVASVFEAVTGQPATANYSENYTRFGKRATPFVCLLALCLQPIDEAAVTDTLGAIAYRALESAGTQST